jgi:hypothetical protein
MYAGAGLFIYRGRAIDKGHRQVMMNAEDDIKGG